MRGPRIRDVLVALVGGVVVHLWRWPATGQDSQPPRCWNPFGVEVACGQDPLPLAVAVATALLAVMWATTVARDRRECSRTNSTPARLRR